MNHNKRSNLLGVDYRHNKRKHTKTMATHIALANIEKMDMASLIELRVALGDLKKHNITPTLICLCETWENIDAKSNHELQGYTYIGKPITRNPGATRDHGGTGAWILDSMFNQSSTVETKKKHKDIMWLQVVDAENTTYTAIVYSRPKDVTNHAKIMATLKHNYTELSKTGRVVIVGDMNTRITRTTHNAESKYGEYEKHLLDMMKATELRPLVASRGAIERDEHWTFVGRTGGRSINDYISVEQQAIKNSAYQVHQHVNLQSQHRLITATLPYVHSEDSEGWGAQDKLTYKWDEDGIKHYHDIITKKYRASYLQDIINSQKHATNNAINITTKHLMEIIVDGFGECATKTPGIAREQYKHKPFNKQLNDLIQIKSTVLNSMKHASKLEAKIKWLEVHAIQKQIQSITAKEWKSQHESWWKELSEMDDDANASEFWRLVEKFKPHMGKQFPSIMEDGEGGRYRTKSDIMNHIKKFYTDISNNDDTQAHAFYKSENLSEKEIKDISTNAENKSRNTFRQNEEREPEHGPCDDNITWKELLAAIDRLKNGKSTGSDNIPSEALKHLPDIIKEALLHLVNMMWALSTTPAEWNTAITALLHKKGDRLQIKNYRPITLLTSMFKMWEGILETRTRTVIEGVYPPDLQMGSRKQNSAAYTIMAKQCLIRLAKATGQSVISLQIDMNKAYNRVCRDMLWADLYEYGVRGKLLKAIVSTYASAKEAIRIGGNTSDLFSLLNGLRQGSVLSPVLYILYTVKLIKALERTNTGISQTTGGKIPCLMFVDDLDTLPKNMDEVITQLKAIQAYALSHKGVINMQKSSLSTSGDMNLLIEAVHASNMTLEVVAEYVHLGAKYKPNHTHTQMGASPDVVHRLSKGRAMMSEMTARGMGRTELSHQPILSIIQKRVVTTVTYGISSLSTTKTDRMLLNKILADGVRLALQWDIEGRETTDWVILESNLLPPTVITQMNTVAAWIRAVGGKINPIIRKLFEQDDVLHAHIITTCNNWHLTILELNAVKDKDLYKTLREAYVEHTRMCDAPNELELP